MQQDDGEWRDQCVAQGVFHDHHPIGQPLEHGGANIRCGHHLGHGRAGHAGDIAEIIRRQHQDRQNHLFPLKSVGHRAGAGQYLKTEYEHRREQHRGGELRHRGGDDAGDRNHPILDAALLHAGQHTEDQRQEWLPS